MRFALVLLILFSIFASAALQAQQPNVWVPAEIQSLQTSASSKTGFTFDHSMLVLASKLEPQNEDLRRVIAGIDGVSVQDYHFQSPAQYDSAALGSVGREYKTAGWKQLMNKHDIGPEMTDLWVRLENNAISNVAILVARPREVSFVTVSGSISPADLSHLGGHFGIPKIEGGVVIPNTVAH